VLVIDGYGTSAAMRGRRWSKVLGDGVSRTKNFPSASVNGYIINARSSTVPITGSVTLGNDSSAATASVSLSSSVAITLGGDAAAGSADLSFTGAASITLAGDTLSAAGAASMSAAGAFTLGGDAAAGAVALVIPGAGAVTLQSDTLVASGTVVMASIVTGAIALRGDTAAASSTLNLSASGAAALSGDTVYGQTWAILVGPTPAKRIGIVAAQNRTGGALDVPRSLVARAEPRSGTVPAPSRTAVEDDL
jgi:hypothetical protein